MKTVNNIVAMIPARIGSTRLTMKNLALIDGAPLISYAINAAKSSGIFSRIVVNSDAAIFEEIARRYGVEFYQRPLPLGSSETKSDHVVYDFIQNHECDILCWVNSTSPLQTGEEISAVIQYFISENLDSLITVKNEQVHALFNGRPVNYKMDELFAQTQDLVPVQPFVYSIMMWRTKPFIEAFEKNGHALFVGNVGFYPVNKLSSIIIKTREDLKLAEQIFKSLKSDDSDKVEYDPLVHTLLKDKPNS